MNIPPMQFQWDGEAMRPRHPRRADRHFVVGMTYVLAEWEERSQASHGHYFAELHNAWLNLPERLAEDFPTAEHLRKYALIKAGYCDERSIVCLAREEAQRVAALAGGLDPFAVVTVEGSLVRVFTAKSQSRRAMNRQDFQDSKSKVLEIVSAMIGVGREQLERERTPA